MKKKLTSLSLLLVLTSVLMLPYFVFAQSPAQPPAASVATPVHDDTNQALKRLRTVAESGGYTETDLAVVIGTVIRAALSLLGGVFLILIVIGGYDWMTAEGNEQKVEKAQNYIRRAIIGLIITLSAWAIWDFLLRGFILS